MSGLCCLQADEPIADYEAMDDVYQGKACCVSTSLNLRMNQNNMNELLSHTVIHFSSVGMPEEGFKGKQCCLFVL